eukprot:1808177-Amphidinium_carterae.1
MQCHSAVVRFLVLILGIHSRQGSKLLTESIMLARALSKGELNENMELLPLPVFNSSQLHRP